MRAINQWREFMLERDISPTARLIGFCLAQYYRPEKLTYPSQATLMRDSGYSRNTVREAVRELEREGLVKIEEKVIRGNSFKSFSYTFIGSTGDPISNPMADPSINPSINPSTNRSINPSINRSINRLAVDPEIYKDNKEKKNIKKETNKEKKDELFSIFEEAWKKYPTRCKRTAKTEYEHLQKSHKDWKEIVPLLKEAVIKFAEIAVAKKEEKGTTIKHMQGWITDRRWEMYLQEDEEPEKPKNLKPVVGENVDLSKWRLAE